MDDLNELPTIPDDIIAEILTRLPVKSLLRFRCVCKGWNFLIQAPDFIKSHLERAVACMNENSSMRVLMSAVPGWSIMCENLDDLDDDMYSGEKMMFECVAFESRDLGKEVTIVGSCNGLVCVRLWTSFIVWNPSTGVIVEVAGDGGSVDPGWDYTYSYHHIYGFGYDSTIDDYKIVKVGCDQASGKGVELEIEIFTLRGGAWRKLNNDRLRGVSVTKMGVFANEAIHWQHLTPGDSGLRTAIVSFDLAKEMFEEGVLQLPDYDCYKSSVSDLRVLGEKLTVLIRNIEWMPSGKFEIWVMEEFGVKESWTKKVNVTYPMYGYHMTPLCFSKNGSLLVAADDEMLMLYDPKYGRYRKLKVSFPWSKIWDREYAVEYVETLVSPVPKKMLN